MQPNATKMQQNATEMRRHILGAFKYNLWPIEAGHAGKLAIKVKTTDRQQFGNVGGGVVWRVAACRVEGYLWSWEVAMAGNWRQVAHFEEWLCALLAPLLLLLSGGGEEAEKALIISIDCASSRPRDTAASGQHRPRGCPPIILKTALSKKISHTGPR